MPAPALIINKAYVLILLSLDFADREQVLAGTGLDAETLEQLDFIELSAAVTAVENLQRLSSEKNWAAIFGRHLGAASHGPVGYALLSAPSLGKALTTFAEWFVIRCQFYAHSILENEHDFEIRIFDTTGNAMLAEVFFESFMRAFEILIALLLGRAPRPAETQICFRTEARERRELMLAEYNSRLVFACEHNRIFVAKDLWYRASPLHDPESYDFNLRRCQQILEQQRFGDRLDLQIKQLLKAQFEQNLSCSALPQPPPSLEAIAATLHINRRTIIRRLNAYGASYKSLLESVRADYAQTLLNNARYSIADVSDLLGYKEPANFCRAFKAWTKTSPSQFRRNS